MCNPVPAIKEADTGFLRRNLSLHDDPEGEALVKLGSGCKKAALKVFSCERVCRFHAENLVEKLHLHC